jgi:signal transduction histidine kinase
MDTQRPAVSRLRGMSVWACVIAAVVLVACIGSAIAVFDIRRDVQTKRDGELSRLVSHAERSASHIATQLAELADASQASRSRVDPTDLWAIRRTRWLRTYWTQSLARQPYRLYAAVVDLDGKVVAHTSRDREHLQIGEEALHNSRLLAGNRFLELRDDVLTGRQRALDVQVPIQQGDKVIGLYHAGLDADWLDEVLDEERDKRSQFWLRLISGMCGVLLLSSVAVVRVTRHTASLEHMIEAANARRISEMNELVLGLAHEIRNPLNAIRLNIHTVGQVFRDEAALTDHEISLMLDEMESEIARLESLMREMLGFVRRSSSKAAPIEVAEEIQRTLTLMRGTLDDRRCEVRVDFSDEPCIVAMDRMRLRQVLFNLLNNALEAQGYGGSIDIQVMAARGQVEISVCDDGPGIAASDRERIFVPFFSTKASGTGLGLALARKFIEEAGGTIHCEGNQRRRGTCFRIVLPASSEEVVEVVS